MLPVGGGGDEERPPVAQGALVGCCGRAAATEEMEFLRRRLRSFGEIDRLINSINRKAFLSLSFSFSFSFFSPSVVQGARVGACGRPVPEADVGPLARRDAGGGGGSLIFLLLEIDGRERFEGKKMINFVDASHFSLRCFLLTRFQKKKPFFSLARSAASHPPCPLPTRSRPPPPPRARRPPLPRRAPRR